MENLSRVLQKQEKKNMSFITQFKIEFLLPFTSCRKVLGKMPDMIRENYEYNSFKYIIVLNA